MSWVQYGLQHCICQSQSGYKFILYSIIQSAVYPCIPLERISAKPPSRLANKYFTTLCDQDFLASYELSHKLCCKRFRICSMCFRDGIKSLQNSGHAHYSEAIKCDLKYHNESHED